MSKAVKVLSLSEIGRGCVDEDRKCIVLPQVQRGKVWNAVRVEILWDSILRGLPIGVFSIKSVADGWELMDGQQRSTAIAMAFDFDGLDKNDSLSPILWMDIGKFGVLTDETDICHEKTNSPNRRFYFKVTTAAHPWGYGDSCSETANDIFAIGRQREVMERTYAEVGKWKIGSRPCPAQVWPVVAEFPVPMPVIVEFLQSSAGEKSYGAFARWCGENPKVARQGWFLHNGFEKHANVQMEEVWSEIAAQIQKALQTYQVTASVVEVKPSDVGLYFSRMNKSGVEPSAEEIQYCLLKDSLKDAITSRKIWDRVDACAASLGMSASRFVSVLLRLLINREADEPKHLTGELSLSEVLGVRMDLADFVDDDRGVSFGAERKWTVYRLVDELRRQFCGDDEMLRWVLRDVVTAQDGVLLLLFMRLLAASDGATLPGRLTMTGLMTYLLWFSSDLVSSVRTLWTSGSDISSGLYLAMRGVGGNGELLRPITNDDFEKIETVLHDKELSGFDFVAAFKTAVTGSRAYAALSMIGCGFNGSDKKSLFQPAYGRSLLIYACRKYLQSVFAGYIPGQPQWLEQNTPWDFDHVIPQKRLTLGSGAQTYDTLATLLWSIGNAAPIPLQINRSKNAKAADPYYPYCKGEVPLSAARPDGTCEVELAGLLLKNDLIALDRDLDCPEWENRPELVRRFCCATFSRLRAIYHDWFESCGIGSIVDLSASRTASKDCRNMFLRCLLEQGREDELDCAVWYVSGNREYEVKTDSDWSRPWLTFGVRIKSEEYRSIVAISAYDFDGLSYEVGIRKDCEEEAALASRGERMLKEISSRGLALSGFENAGWWYFYQHPRKVARFDLDAQVSKAYSAFKTVYSIAETAGFLGSEEDRDDVDFGDDNSHESDAPENLLDVGMDN